MAMAEPNADLRCDSNRVGPLMQELVNVCHDSDGWYRVAVGNAVFVCFICEAQLSTAIVFKLVKGMAHVHACVSHTRLL